MNTALHRVDTKPGGCTASACSMPSSATGTASSSTRVITPCGMVRASRDVQGVEERFRAVVADVDAVVPSDSVGPSTKRRRVDVPADRPQQDRRARKREPRRCKLDEAPPVQIVSPPIIVRVEHPRPAEWRLSPDVYRDVHQGRYGSRKDHCAPHEPESLRDRASCKRKRGRIIDDAYARRKEILDERSDDNRPCPGPPARRPLQVPTALRAAVRAPAPPHAPAA